ncbi:MAG: hypothetical protein ACI8QF_002851, partial [Limisphaerales bacterium]
MKSINPQTLQRSSRIGRIAFSLGMALAVVGVGAASAPKKSASKKKPRVVVAKVVALDQPWMWNRLGAAQPQGMMFALECDVVPSDAPIGHTGGADPATLKPGEVRLRSDKRPRPIALRVNQGDILEVQFRNLLAHNPVNGSASTRYASFHSMGLELVGSIISDGSWVGKNPGETGSLAAPGESVVYRFFAKEEGVYMAFSGAGGSFDWGDDQISAGLFGSVNVQPKGAEYYRSQVTQKQLAAATYNAESLPKGWKLSPKPVKGKAGVYKLSRPEAPTIKVNKAKNGALSLSRTKYQNKDVPNGQPLVDYDSRNSGRTLADGTKIPVLGMTVRNRKKQIELVRSDLTAIITGKNRGYFNGNSPSFRKNPTEPNRRRPYREFSINYHAPDAVQAFGAFYNTETTTAYKAGRDGFAINYGMAAIGPEIVANRIGVGPEGNADSVDLKYEEFFLSSWCVGDPAMVVDVPANAPNQLIDVTAGQGQVIPTGIQGKLPTIQTDYRQAVNQQPNPRLPLGANKATKAFYPDDPSNVYHSYMQDHVKMRVINSGISQAHVHHLHAHQWLRSPNDDNSSYLDSQLITTGSAYTTEITYNGSGNVNYTVGDSIFHCHFYPHFAQGMWSLWRVHDVFEAGTKLDKNGRPLKGARALPDGELVLGSPIPGLVPIPHVPLAPMPAKVSLTNLAPYKNDGQGRRVKVHPEADGKYKNPGYPFFIPGVAGHRTPSPPLDIAVENGIRLDGGLPRHIILDGVVFEEFHTRWDFTKDVVVLNDKGEPIDGSLTSYEVPEDGTAIEKVAMKYHSVTNHPTLYPNGLATSSASGSAQAALFRVNPLPPVSGAPYASPAVGKNGLPITGIKTNIYKAAVIQIDSVTNKKGYHYPQQRVITLWDDVKPTVSGERPPQPFFFRGSSHSVIEFWHMNLVPNYYEMDDFQVRTPTDIIGQHIHLVKFDVTSSDGAANGFNYFDGTLAPNEVQEQIFAINQVGGLYAFDPATQFVNTNSQKKLTVTPYDTNRFGPAPAGQNWNGAQTTVQRWYLDPTLNNKGYDRTLRSVFTHDHFGPSTHQQAGLYASLLVEPEDTIWEIPEVSNDNGKIKTTYTQGMTRDDGGPTSWTANIINTTKPNESYREFALEMQDLAFAYLPESRSKLPKKALSNNMSGPSGKLCVIPNYSTNVTQTVAGGVTNLATNIVTFSVQLSRGAVSQTLSRTLAVKGVSLSATNGYTVVMSPPRGPDAYWRLQQMQTNSLLSEVILKDLGYALTLSSDGNTLSVFKHSALGFFGNMFINTDKNDPRFGETNRVAELIGVANIPPGEISYVVNAFATNGITLTTNATARSSNLKQDNFQGWFITDDHHGARIVYTLEIAPYGGDYLFLATPEIHPGWSQPNYAVNPPIDLNNIASGAPFPSLVSISSDGMYSVNYRNEPTLMRVDPNPANAVTLGTQTQTNQATDLAYVFSSIPRFDPKLNQQPKFGSAIDPNQPDGFKFPNAPLTEGYGDYDPFTPLLRVYAGDKVQVRVLPGAHLVPHSFQIQGVNWDYEPTDATSGLRNVQGMGISEHFEFLFNAPSNPL